ncbi:MAG: TIGR01777 family protein [Verrucomicrobia bacterium]|nr:MAG: TIGR01777 family protein [Verrucomicrobiota bacterium]
MKIGITGGTGFIGNMVRRAALTKGDEVLLFSRRQKMEGRLFSFTHPLDVSGCDGLVHLAGESIIGLWTREKRRKIMDSRVEGTRRLVEGIAAAEVRPKVLVSASAIGYYGDTGEVITDEDAPPGTGFLSEVAQTWEAEALKAESLGVRVVLLRIGFVLGREGGAMNLIKPAFRAGLGGRLGSGRQWMSCIEVGDLASMVMECLHNDAIRGPMNAVMPSPVTNAVFTKAAARASHRPALFPAPTFALRLALGDLSHVMLDSQRIIPKNFTGQNFTYRFKDVDSAMQEVFR